MKEIKLRHPFLLLVLKVRRVSFCDKQSMDVPPMSRNGQAAPCPTSAPPIVPSQILTPQAVVRSRSSEPMVMLSEKRRIGRP